LEAKTLKGNNMKIPRRKLRKIIKEELSRSLLEQSEDLGTAPLIRGGFPTHAWRSLPDEFKDAMMDLWKKSRGARKFRKIFRRVLGAMRNSTEEGDFEISGDGSVSWNGTLIPLNGIQSLLQATGGALGLDAAAIYRDDDRSLDDLAVIWSGCSNPKHAEPEPLEYNICDREDWDDERKMAYALWHHRRGYGREVSVSDMMEILYNLARDNKTEWML
tara:strand:- start:1891 stop:2541 length:651 start_codon:yes stop_codon:yes gene_type:complete